MKSIIHRVRRLGGAAGPAILLAGCGLSHMGGPPGGPATSAAVTIPQAVPPSALLTVISSPASGPALSGLMAGTARPDEDVRILAAGSPGVTIVASDSPAPSPIVIPGPPAPPGSGATAFQSAQYAKRLKAWQAERAEDVRAGAAQTREQVSAWLNSLAVSQKISRLADPPQDDGCLAAESEVATSALAGLEEEAGNVFGNRRVLVLFCDNLSGVLPVGELAGVDVVVVTSYLPTAAAASAAQADLLGADAAQAAVVGPEVTAAQLAALVSADLSQSAEPGDSVSAPVLFGNDSYALSAAAVSELTRLLPQLRKPTVTVVVNGYASTPGTAAANYVLSYRRAAAVADFLESNGVPESSLIVVGHGAADVVGSGVSGANRRVLVVIES
jgi:outer membrane protein OmpA-like peptidoglycan-associated protein